MSSNPADPVPSAQLHPVPYVVEARPDPPLAALLPGPLLLTMAVSFLVITPFFFLGNPSGHDFEFHMFSWMEVVGQWKEGILYPRWASLSHWGYGEARFLFYPPLSWNLGALLGAILPWRMAPGAYIWAALSAAGCSMFLLARRWMPRREAMFAAALYAANPYHLVIVYWRSALAELLASCLLPVLLIWVLSLAEGRRRSIIPLSLIVAAAWLTNGPSAVMVNYSVALLALVIAIVKRQPRILIMAGVAVVLGGLLPSFYLLPAAYEQHWVNLSEVFAPGVRPQDNFLFTTLADVDHNHFNWLVSTVAVAEIVAVLVALSRTATLRRAHRTVWWSLAGWAAAATLLMLPFTAPFWDHLPKLRFVQLPWRWLLCFNVAFAIFVTAAFRRWWQRAAICVAMLITLGILWNRVQPPWWDTAADIDEMHDAIEDGSGYEGTDEYVPAGVDPSDVNKDAPEVTLQGGGSNTRVDIDDWQAQSKRFRVVGSEALSARLRLFNYPAWQVAVDGAPVQPDAVENTGEILVPLAPGKHQVAVTFVRTWDRKVGVLVSALALVLLLAVWLTERGRALNNLGKPQRLNPALQITAKRVLIATSNAGKLRDFAGAAAAHGVEIAAIPNFTSLPTPIEDGATFAENAIKKANAYSVAVPGQIVVADDSGLEVDALDGAPGVHSARYAADEPHRAEANTDDDLNNARVLRELEGVPAQKRSARFVCMLAAARDGVTLATFHGVAEGRILTQPRGNGGFGYDPLFYFPSIGRTFAELSPEEKSKYSHRGAAFRQFLEWCDRAGPNAFA